MIILIILALLFAACLFVNDAAKNNVLPELIDCIRNENPVFNSIPTMKTVYRDFSRPPKLFGMMYKKRIKQLQLKSKKR